MPALSVLTVRHTTVYRYAAPVAFGEHRMMLRPRDDADQRLVDHQLAISPEPRRFDWLKDAFGNWVGVAEFGDRARQLRFDSTKVVEHLGDGLKRKPADGRGVPYPLAYRAGDPPDPPVWMVRTFSDPRGDVEHWAKTFVRPAAGALTLLRTINAALHRDFRYIRRLEKGVQEPASTLRLRTGSCRDLAVLLIDAVRALGFAARFVSGYLRVSSGGTPYVGGGSTHAWAQVYVPDLGWLDLDPTNNIVGNRDLVRVAVAPDPRQAIPLFGTFLGRPADRLGMAVTVSVTAGGAIGADERRRA